MPTPPTACRKSYWRDDYEGHCLPWIWKNLRTQELGDCILVSSPIASTGGTTPLSFLSSWHWTWTLPHTRASWDSRPYDQPHSPSHGQAHPMGSAIWQLDKVIFDIAFISVLSTSGVLILWFLPFFNRNESVSVSLERGMTKGSYDRVITSNDYRHLFAVICCMVVPLRVSRRHIPQAKQSMFSWKLHSFLGGNDTAGIQVPVGIFIRTCRTVHLA